MFVVYFFEGVIVGSFLGLLLRPALDYYVTWRRARALEHDDAVSIRVDLGRPARLPTPERGRSGQDERVDHRTIAKG
jgi:hypothetical protein